MARNQSDPGLKKLSVYLIVDQEPLPLVLGVFRVAMAKDNIYAITHGKWDDKGGFYGILDESWQAPTRQFQAQSVMMQKVMEEVMWRSVCDNCLFLSTLSINDGDGIGTNIVNISPGSLQPSLKNHGHMLHFDNFRTFYTNGSLTLVVNDLNLDRLTSWTCCKIMSVATSWIGMINTLGFQRLWAITKVFVLVISKRDYGRGYRNGRANYSVFYMNSLSKLLPNQSRYTRCIVSSFRSIFVMILTALLLISGGVGLQTLRRFIGSLGRSFAFLKKKVGSGFRNLYAFNLSFLAKQGWKSICSSRSIIDQGSRWRIPYGFLFPLVSWIFSLKPPDHAAHFIYDLIDDSQNWNVSLLKFLFSDFETNCILSLPLSLRKPDDCLLWHFDNKGNFSVKNADQVAQDWLASYRDRASLSPTPNTFGEIWKKMVTQLSTSCVIVLSLDVSGLPLLLATHPVLRLNQRFSSGVPAVPHI
ncbi:hypothetical protein D8674_028731 [Pyrus ussuriensis x Pyrus communis]|uniref:Uncharacterized protein n=1 Tax=Pyrus ussuriensis x Pyrus communis TaxID=2448454 RepID=A0A5N5IAK7_9ROSA|nr:hypothetical protein D8674_028731 [Pyrus ussuriensis x Pyrus communis]